jgi:hypothetical protein
MNIRFHRRRGAVSLSEWVISSSQTPPLVEEEAGGPISKVWNEQKFDHGSHTGPDTKNNCAGEGQKQFTGPAYLSAY